ncbi:flavodoxin family protein [Vibrio nitrifigilis]|uniref:NAD(P)H-dependent oxidoreductase n=1 Tax=Vibrio nitrifigilis TaxID=2789781 RepID=A0ABS0GD50_9VIBR|nr:NAD(P)H-dependent oxidoreductase [Vibrio nitrifigilis]MBF9000343.1 NAD(P)H-dependent oxidoreductase [Vibrio nitrifigilis]
MKVAVVLGTSKQDGNTRKLVDEFVQLSGATLLDLTDFDISFYDYLHENRDDHFIPLIKTLTDYEHIVFASPVYWYSMSAQLKVFFDRLSDLLTIEKALGRELKGKSMSVLSTGYNQEVPSCFIEPFQLTAEYLHLTFKGCEYLAIRDNADLARLPVVATKALQNLC